MNTSELWYFTAKRLRNLAQGCRVARLPWDRIVKGAPTLKGSRQIAPLRTST